MNVVTTDMGGVVRSLVEGQLADIPDTSEVKLVDDASGITLSAYQDSSLCYSIVSGHGFDLGAGEPREGLYRIVRPGQISFLALIQKDIFFQQVGDYDIDDLEEIAQRVSLGRYNMAVQYTALCTSDGEEYAAIALNVRLPHAGHLIEAPKTSIRELSMALWPAVVMFYSTLHPYTPSSTAMARLRRCTDDGIATAVWNQVAERNHAPATVEFTDTMQKYMKHHPGRG